MADANTKDARELYLEENLKLMKQLPNDIIRGINSVESLNDKFKENFKSAHNAFGAFQNQSKDHNASDSKEEAEWTAKDDLCLKNLQQMRESEEQMMMFQDEKIALIEQNIHYLESYISKMSKDLDHFRKLLQPNQIKLPFPTK